ncbi:GNAT family N-acetyltransferase [Bacillus sp. RG28]|uniref:GNAT family N-acetyltransferase n=1 Tax=Gottfriedia endophytica TaxID=2820819 RepID=A0A940NJ73_9BACI|nr:GNAT family N-acetyltransferase [Gottfriedia endophytica]MBP0725365.1 GNAT family N-acetyltransferase [Gottfriedia endophytica]
MLESKNNVTYKIRTGTVEDAEAILDIENDVISEGEYFIAESDELEQTPIQKQRDWVQSNLENERETLIVAEMNGVVVGWIVFRSNNKKRLLHTGSITMLIRKNYRGLGIGTMLLEALLGWAEENPYIEKVSLGVFSTNHRAISLYKKMGFLEEGRKINEFKFNDNEYMDDILMYKLVK